MDNLYPFEYLLVRCDKCQFGLGMEGGELTSYCGNCAATNRGEAYKSRGICSGCGMERSLCNISGCNNCDYLRMRGSDMLTKGNCEYCNDIIRMFSPSTVCKGCQIEPLQLAPKPATRK